MSQRLNCFQVIGAELVEGIPQRMSILSQDTLPLKGVQKLEPEERVLFGRAYPAPEPYNYVVCCNAEEFDCNSFIVYVEVLDLNFGGQPFLEGLNIWPGPEMWKKEPFWRKMPKFTKESDARQTLERAEIWSIHEEQKLLLVDQFGGVRILVRKRAELQMHETNPVDMATYFHKIGTSTFRHRGIVWARENLARLQQGFPNHDFSRELAEVQQKLDRLDRKVS